MRSIQHNSDQFSFARRFASFGRRFFLITSALLCAFGIFANPYNSDADDFSEPGRLHRVLILIAEPQYQTSSTLPEFANRFWNAEQGFETRILQGDPGEHHIQGMEEGIRWADAVLISVRRQAFPAGAIEALKSHLDAGKPVIGIRTANHAFHARGRGPDGGLEWAEFDPEVLGGSYHGHYAEGPLAKVEAIQSFTREAEIILEGVEFPFQSAGSLYKTQPLAADTIPLLSGTIDGKPAEPVAWARYYGSSHAPVFYTSLGFPSDFEQPGFQKLLINAMFWGLEAGQ